VGDNSMGEMIMKIVEPLVSLGKKKKQRNTGLPNLEALLLRERG